MKKAFSFTKIDRIKLIGISIKAVTGVLGVSVILTEGHPYLTIGILAAGALADQIVIYIKEKENENNTPT